MDKTEHIRLLDELGRVVLPAEVRNAMGWGEKTPIEIWADVAAQEVIMKRHRFTCAFCPETENLRAFGKRYICPACQRAVASL